MIQKKLQELMAKIVDENPNNPIQDDVSIIFSMVTKEIKEAEIRGAMKAKQILDPEDQIDLDDENYEEWNKLIGKDQE